MSHNLKILCVDDEKDLNDILRDAFELEGFSVTCASSAEDALIIMTSEKFDVVISDQCMGGLDGDEFLIKVNGLVAKMPLFYLCTGNSTLIEKDLSSYGLTDIIEKPYDVFSLAEQVHNKLTNK